MTKNPLFSITSKDHEDKPFIRTFVIPHITYIGDLHECYGAHYFQVRICATELVKVTHPTDTETPSQLRKRLLNAIETYYR